MIVSERMARHLRAAGIEPRTDDHIPTGAEVLAELLEPLAGLPELADHIVCGAEVIGVGRDGLLKHEEIGSAERAARPFRILLRRNGVDATDSADLVFDCTGTHATPNAAGDSGLPAPGEEELGDRIAHWLPDLVRDRDAWAGRTILLIGSGYGAQTAARDLAALLPSAPGTQVIWAVRHAKPTWGEAEGDPFPERQALVDSAKWIAAGNVPGLRVELGTAVDAFKPEGDRILVRLRGSAQREIVVDRVLALTGYVPDNSIYRQLQMHECYADHRPDEPGRPVARRVRGRLRGGAQLRGRDAAVARAELLRARRQVVRPQQPVPRADRLRPGQHRHRRL